MKDSKDRKDQKAFYITTTLPYVNAKPHVGHAMELIRADIIARFKKSQGFEVFFNTGTDEHGQKLLVEATKRRVDVQVYVDEYAAVFRSLIDLLSLSPDIHFVRTTDRHHKESAQAFWKLCDKNGFIYKKNYQVKYCVGCELEKTESELVDGKCPLHPNREIELIDEENYFFKFSAFKDRLLALYEDHPDVVIPASRLGEIKNFVSRGLEDFSISRLKEKMSWGVDVPGDSEHVMYVWFDALVNYISTLGWPEDEETFNTFWRDAVTVQYCGKDNLRQQAAMWQAMLMAVDLPSTSHVIINGFVTGSGGVKMSKSLGNVINPYDVVAEYGPDALRYFIAREISTFEDSPFTMERFQDAYNANLANGLGNLVSRIMKMAETHLDTYVPEEHKSHGTINDLLLKFEIQKAMNHIWEEIGKLDAEIQEKKPWESKDKEVINHLVSELDHIAQSLAPFMPETSAKIKSLIEENKMPSEPLFSRKI